MGGSLAGCLRCCGGLPMAPRFPPSHRRVASGSPASCLRPTGELPPAHRRVASGSPVSCLWLTVFLPAGCLTGIWHATHFYSYMVMMMGGNSTAKPKPSPVNLKKKKKKRKNYGADYHDEKRRGC